MLDLRPPLCKFHPYLSNNQPLDFVEFLMVLIVFLLQILWDARFLDHLRMLPKTIFWMQFSNDKSFSVLVHQQLQTAPLIFVFRIQNDTKYI